MTKGFITLAVGDYYLKLAQHLYMSYKIYSNCTYPFYVITDSKGADYLTNNVVNAIIL